MGLGALLGWTGSFLLAPIGLRGAAGPWLLAALIPVGVAFDVRLGRVRLPSIRRQVNEDWLRRYRGWVYGVGFGAQLGLGFATVVSLSAVYLTFAAAFLSAGPLAGALVGGAFGMARGATLLTVAGVHRMDQLVRVDATLRRWDRPAGVAAVAAEVILLATLVLAAIR